METLKRIASFLGVSLVLASCYKEDTCIFMTYSGYSSVQGVFNVENRYAKYRSVDSQTCDSLVQAKLTTMSGTYLWLGNEVQKEELVYCNCLR